MKYLPDGSVDWGTMWDSYCARARDGGPPHRGTMLYANESSAPASDAYRAAVREIIRGITAVSRLRCGQPDCPRGFITLCAVSRCQTGKLRTYVYIINQAATQ